MFLLSRVAESLFWLGRYVERAESTARLLDVTYHGRLEPQATEVAGARNTWEAMMRTLGDGPGAKMLASAAGDPEAAAVDWLTVSRANSSSIVSCLAAARENARSVRDFLSSETWVSINRLYHATSQRNVHLIMADGLYEFCDEVRHGVGLFAGLAASTSLHDEGWHWLQTGIHLERADMITRIVDSKYHLILDSAEEVGGVLDRHQWIALLRSLSGFEAFRRTHAGGFEPGAIVEFLVLDRRFPRSLRASVDSLLSSIDGATEGADRRLQAKALRPVTDLRNHLEFENVDSLIATGLHEFFLDAQATLREISSAVNQTFFWAAGSAA